MTWTKAVCSGDLRRHGSDKLRVGRDRSGPMPDYRAGSFGPVQAIILG
jgi:hypothetical protein